MEQLCIPLQPKMFVRNKPNDSGEDFSVLSMYFRYFVIISPWKRARPFIWTILNSPYTKDDLCLVWLKFTPVVLEKNIFKFRKWIFVTSLLSALGKGWGLHLNKLEYPYSKDALCQVWLKLAQWFLRRFLNFVIVFSFCRNYLHLEIGLALHLNTLEPLFNQGCFVSCLVEIATMVLENKSKM